MVQHATVVTFIEIKLSLFILLIFTAIPVADTVGISTVSGTTQKNLYQYHAA